MIVWFGDGKPTIRKNVCYRREEEADGIQIEMAEKWARDALEEDTTERNKQR